MSMSMTQESQNGELKREMALGETAFGMDGEEVLTRLKTDEEFREVFMSQFVVVHGLVKEFKKWEKESKALARAKASSEKEDSERARLREVIGKIKENDPEVEMEPEAVLGDFLEGSSIKYLKEWVKNYRTAVKAAKEAEKQAKLDAKAEKEAAKQAKLNAKLDKQTGQMIKMEADLEKWNDLVGIEVLSFVGKMSSAEHFSEMKTYHTRIKFLVQLAKFAENVEGVPDYDEETISDDDLKEMHTRCKLLNQLTKLDIPIDYGTEKTIDDLKDTIKHAKNATTTEN